MVRGQARAKQDWGAVEPVTGIRYCDRSSTPSLLLLLTCVCQQPPTLPGSAGRARRGWVTRRPRRCLYIIGWDILSSSSGVPLFLDGERMWDEGRGRSLSLLPVAYPGLSPACGLRWRAARPPRSAGALKCSLSRAPLPPSLQPRTWFGRST